MLLDKKQTNQIINLHSPSRFHGNNLNLFTWSITYQIFNRPISFIFAPNFTPCCLKTIDVFTPGSLWIAFMTEFNFPFHCFNWQFCFSYFIFSFGNIFPFNKGSLTTHSGLQELSFNRWPIRISRLLLM